jgi:hypothetical protein
MTEETPAIIPDFLALARAVRHNVHGGSADPSDSIDLRRAYLNSS